MVIYPSIHENLVVVYCAYTELFGCVGEYNDSHGHNRSSGYLVQADGTPEWENETAYRCETINSCNTMLSMSLRNFPVDLDTYTCRQKT